MQIRQYVSERKDAVMQNLSDADCPQEVIRQFMQNAEEDRQTQAIQVLEKHRRTLLDRVHREEKYIERLDYLLYSLRK